MGEGDPSRAAQKRVMPGLVPGIHALGREQLKTWMAGTSPTMTKENPLPASGEQECGAATEKCKNFVSPFH
jgi:hypothetical protein